ncbi:MAG TPA: NAD(P)H-hydrate dehydratase [Verrucomicrobiae bacterium]|nr:NAD(P)H-hydrate dehydratase [Verrucomicrobiae bacterium]
MSGTPVISVPQMRRWEKASWAAGAKEAEVIARVGRCLAQRLMQLTRPGDTILLLAGAGHNGDDVRAAIPHLKERNARLINVNDPRRRVDFQNAAWIVDGLFGIGLNRPLDAHWQKLIRSINEAGIPVLSVDTPSGLNVANGKIEGAAVQAAVTLTVGAPKAALIGQPQVGRLEVAAEVGLIPCTYKTPWRWTLPEDFAGLPPKRAPESNKGTYGHAAIIAGSLGYHGAAVLSSHGALRAQPGLVSIFPQPEVYAAVAAQSQAAMVHPWRPEIELPKSTSAVLIGSGLAAADLPEALNEQAAALWKSSPLAVVADASALPWLKRGSTRHGAVRVITPHPGEAGRLLDSSAAEVQRDRPAALRALSRLLGGCLVVLKGHQTLVGRATGPIFINSSGNPFLAQGGSGDLLGGYITGLLAQPAWQTDALETVRYAVWQHGAAADLLAASRPNWTVEDLSAQLGMVKVG